jgi:hypothetical protein
LEASKGPPTPSQLQKRKNIKALQTLQKDFEQMDYFTFNSLIKNAEVRFEVCRNLPMEKTNLQELMHWVELCDKEQFKRYSLKQITFA